MRSGLAILLIAAFPAVAQTPVLGVLEHPQCKEDGLRAVRPLFSRKNGLWHSLDSPPTPLPQSVDWQVVEAKAPGATLRTPSAPPPPQPSWTYARDFLLQPAPNTTLPLLPNPEKLYSGWCGAPENRPIFLVTGGSRQQSSLAALPNVSQTQNKSALLRAFNASFGTTRLCTDENDSKPVRLTAADLSIPTNLQLPTGARLMALSLKRELTECKSERGGVDLPRWFVVDGSRARFLGASLSFITAGDFDGDGTLEYLFWHSGYNRDGYVIFDAAFKASARFLWSYH